MSYFQLECKRMLKSKNFRLALIFSIIIVLVDVGQDVYIYYQGINHFSIFEKWMGVRYSTYGSVIWNFLFIFFVSIPYSCSLCSELKSHYSLHIISKIGKNKYFFTKVTISFISGFLISFITLFMDFVLMAMYNQATYPEVDSMYVAIEQNDFLSAMFYTKPYIYCIAWLLVICIWGGILSILTLSVSLFLKRASYSLILSEILFILQAVLAGFFTVKINGRGVELSWMGLLYGDSLSLNPWYAIFGSQLILSFVCIVIIWWKGRRYSYV